MCVCEVELQGAGNQLMYAATHLTSQTLLAAVKALHALESTFKSAKKQLQSAEAKLKHGESLFLFFFVFCKFHLVVRFSAAGELKKGKKVSSITQFLNEAGKVLKKAMLGIHKHIKAKMSNKL